MDSGFSHYDPTITLFDLPSEMLAKIFSYLNHKDLPTVSLCSRKCYDVLLHYKVWEDAASVFNRREKFLSFCSLFERIPYLRTLSLTGSFEMSNDEKDTLTNLLENLDQLHCLKMAYLDISTIYFPFSLKHFTCYTNSDIYDTKNLIYSTKLCATIEHLTIEDEGTEGGEKKLSMVVISLLKQFKDSLKTLHLLFRKTVIDSRVINYIVKCRNLKELSVCGWDLNCRGSTADLFYSFSALPSLERLFVTAWEVPSEKKMYEFPKLRHLSIGGKGRVSGYEYRQMLKKMPQLETICLSSAIGQTDIETSLTSCKKLANIYLLPNLANCESMQAIKFMFHLQEKNHFPRACYCTLNVPCNLPVYKGKSSYAINYWIKEEKFTKYVEKHLFSKVDAKNMV